MMLKRVNFPWFLMLAVAIGGLLAADSFGNNAKVENFIGVSSLSLAGFAFLALGIVRVSQLLTLSRSALLRYSQNVFLVLAACTFAVAGLLTVWTFLSPPNVVYSLTRLHPLQLLALSQFFGGVWLLLQSNLWWKNHFSRLLQLFPIFLFAVSFLVSLLPFDVFVPYASEDGLMEHIQSMILVTGIGICVREFLQQRSKVGFRQKSAWLFLVIAAGLFIILMEEISWGQRIFHWQTPNQLSAVNVQNETTIHNIGILNQLQLVAYIVLSGLGMILSRVRLPRLWQRWYFWAPPPSSTLLFTFPFLFYTGNVLFNTPYHLWAEIMEVVFYTGIVVWIAAGAHSVPKYRSP